MRAVPGLDARARSGTGRNGQQGADRPGGAVGAAHRRPAGGAVPGRLPGGWGHHLPQELGQRPGAPARPRARAAGPAWCQVPAEPGRGGAGTAGGPARGARRTGEHAAHPASARRAAGDHGTRRAAAWRADQRPVGDPAAAQRGGGDPCRADPADRARRAVRAFSGMRRQPVGRPARPRRLAGRGRAGPAGRGAAGAGRLARPDAGPERGRGPAVRRPEHPPRQLPGRNRRAGPVRGARAGRRRPARRRPARTPPSGAPSRYW